MSLESITGKRTIWQAFYQQSVGSTRAILTEKEGNAQVLRINASREIIRYIVKNVIGRCTCFTT